MAPRALRFHFDYLSPYSYLAWHRVAPVAQEHDLRVEPKPTLLAALLDHLGHKGPAEIPPKRAYMFKDCIRAAALLHVPFVPVYSHPFNPLPALRATLLDMEEETRVDLVGRLFDATWGKSLDVGSPEVVGQVCAQVGVRDAVERIRDPAIKQRLRDASDSAMAAGVFGVPTMFVDGELFWGTDSIPHLVRYLEGNDPVRKEDVAAWHAVPASAHRK